QSRYLQVCIWHFRSADFDITEIRHSDPGSVAENVKLGGNGEIYSDAGAAPGGALGFAVAGWSTAYSRG
ncbi:hypothetical protein Q8G41_27640, partial [Klebsiella pneumoniae]|uniref:hypothetical protein n=1 Tax=Klebsiella pneumoniae TaxID=573 RepID=UPI003013DC7A